LKRFIILFLSLSLLLILIPGCFTFQTAPSATGPAVGTPPVIIIFSSNPATISPGDKPTLLWTVSGANSVSIDNGIGPVDIAGTRVISPAASTVYTLSATNSAGTVTRSAVTTVSSALPLQPAPASFAVTSILANTGPSSLTGCFNLYAYITTNGPGTVTYNWESMDGGGFSYTWSVRFPTAGSQKITLPLEMSALPSGSYRVHVLTPNDSVSNSVYYTTCAP
jgi:hypothetical protein